MEPAKQHKTLTIRSPWSEKNLRRYEYLSAEGIAVEHAQSLDFLKDVPRLRRVFIWCFDGCPDVSPVFECPALEDVTLMATEPTPLRADCLPGLQRLQTDWRPGLDSLRDHPALASLVVYGLREADLTWLGTPPNLDSLNLQGKKQTFDVTGLAGLAPTLRSLTLTDLRVRPGTVAPHLPGLIHRQLQVRGLIDG